MQLKTFILCFEQEKLCYLDFSCIWNKFLEINKINLFNHLDSKIFSYNKGCFNSHLLRKSSSLLMKEQNFVYNLEFMQRPIIKENNKKISNSNKNKYSRYNSEITTLSNENKSLKIPLSLNQNIEFIDKRTYSGERISIFKRNRNSCYSSFHTKRINFNNEKENRLSSIKFPKPNKKIVPLHSNFKSDIEINYCKDENNITSIKSDEKKKLPLKKLSEQEIIQNIAFINMTETDSIKGKILDNFKIDKKSGDANYEIDIDLISSNEENNENIDNKNIPNHEMKNSINKHNFDDFLCGGENNDEYDILFKFHSHGLSIENNKLIENSYLEHQSSNEKLRINNYENKKGNDIQKDFPIPKIDENFDIILSEVNPLSKICEKNKDLLIPESQIHLESEKKKNIINKNSISMEYKKNKMIKSENIFEELLKSYTEILLDKDNEDFKVKHYQSWNKNADQFINKNYSNFKQLPLKNSCKKYSHEIEKVKKFNTEQSKKIQDLFILDKEGSINYSGSSINSLGNKNISNKFNNNFNKHFLIPYSKSNLTKKPIRNKYRSHKNIFNPKNGFCQKYNNDNIYKKSRGFNNKKLNLIKSIQKSFKEDEKIKIDYLMSRINSADKKLKCVKLKQREIEKTQFEIIPKSLFKDNNEFIEESFETSLNYENLEIIQVLTFEFLGKDKNESNTKNILHICDNCKKKDK